MSAEVAAAAGASKLLASAAPFIASGVDSLAGLLGMSGSSHYQRRNMREAARLQHEENLFWAEYNSPSNQMARLRDAGLNPNLVYGNGADAQFSGSVSPSGAAPEFKGHPGLDFITYSQMLKQNQNLDKQNEVLTEDARKKSAEANYQEMLNREYAAANPDKLGEYRAQGAKLDLDLKGTEIQKNEADKLMMASKKTLIDMERAIKSVYKEQMLPLEIKKADIENETAQLVLDNLPSKLQKELKLLDSQAAQLSAQIGVFRAQADYLTKQAKLIEKTTDIAEKQKRTEDLKQGLLGLQSVAQDLSNTLHGKTMPAEVINRYLSPANILVRIASGFGMPLGKTLQSIGMTANSVNAPSSSERIISNQSDVFGADPWYY